MLHWDFTQYYIFLRDVSDMEFLSKELENAFHSLALSTVTVEEQEKCVKSNYVFVDMLCWILLWPQLVPWTCLQTSQGLHPMSKISYSIHSSMQRSFQTTLCTYLHTHAN